MTSDRGSVAPLAIGLLLISFATLAVTASAGSLFLEHRRLQTLAESAAVVSASSASSVQQFLVHLPSRYSASFKNLEISSEQVLDGSTIEVRLCADWQNPITSPFAQASAVICAEAKARSVID